jgi:hypothetical protein
MNTKVFLNKVFLKSSIPVDCARNTREIFKCIIKKIEENKIKCKATIKYGKNKDKMCGRINCKINGHDKYFDSEDNIGKCKVIIKKGKNKEQICGRFKCIYHRCNNTSNIATYLRLPNIFEDIVNENRYDYNHVKFIDENTVDLLRDNGFNVKNYILSFEYMFEYMNKKYSDREKAKNISSLLVAHILKKFTFINSKLKILMFILILKLLDTNHGRILVSYPMFCNVVYDKIKFILNELKVDVIKNEFFIKYIEDNFETNGIFLNKHKNKRIEKIKKQSENLLLEKYNDTIEKRYAPGGKGYLESQHNFYLNVNASYKNNFTVCSSCELVSYHIQETVCILCDYQNPDDVFCSDNWYEKRWNSIKL